MQEATQQRFAPQKGRVGEVDVTFRNQVAKRRWLHILPLAMREG